MGKKTHRSRSESATANWADPSYRENVVGALRRHWSDPEVHAEHAAAVAEGIKAMWADPVRRAEIMAKRAATLADPVKREKRLEGFRTKLAATWAAKRALRPDGSVKSKRAPPKDPALRVARFRATMAARRDQRLAERAVETARSEAERLERQREFLRGWKRDVLGKGGRR